ncbi:MAG: SPASM domain-containing protein [Myxococcales bacterium]|nr:SPASM domain-containing protein [Myxococcales bacterium]
MCRIGEFGVDQTRFMARRLFDRCVAELFPRVREVRLNGLGEATLVPFFDHCVDRVSDAGLRGELITNLTCGEATMRRLVSARFVVLISWDAATPALFERLRRPATWAEQRMRLETLSALAAGHGTADHLHLLFTLQRANVGELPGLVKLAADVGVPSVLVNVVKLQDERWVERAQPEIARAVDLARELAQTLGVALTLPDHIGGLSLCGPYVLPTSARGCDRPRKEVVVRWNGEITVCNMFNPYAYGHLERHGFERSWNGSLAAAFRRLVDGPDQHPYCDGCYYVHGVYEREGPPR